MKCLQAVAHLSGAVTLVAATHAGAQTTASGPYYAAPSWDQTLPAATRFVVLSNFNSEAVLDRETGLVWQRTPGISGTDKAGSSFTNCVGATTGGRFGWRLPTIAELGSLFDPHSTSGIGLPDGHPFIVTPAVVGSGFWSTTVNTSVFNSEVTIDVFLTANSKVGNTTPNFFVGSPNAQSYAAWCVRGPGFEGKAMF
jgi:hypothetical protein